MIWLAKFGLGAWSILKPLLPYIAVALVFAGLLSAYGHREYGRGQAYEVAKYQPVMDRAIKRMNDGEVALKTTKTSLGWAIINIRDNNARIKLAADQLIADKAQHAQDQAKNSKLAQSTAAIIAGLKAAQNDPRKPCTLSPAAQKALEGL